MPQTKDFSNALANSILDSATCLGATRYIGLSTTLPTNAGGNITEPAGNNYARKSIASGDWGAAASRQKANVNVVTMATASGSWGTIPYFFISSALTSGTMLMWGTLSNSIAPGSGDTVTFQVGDLVAEFLVSTV